VGIITRAGFIAMKRIELLHARLDQSLQGLEAEMVREREIRLDQQRQYREQKMLQQTESEKSQMEIEPANNINTESSGIDKNDPILQWSNLHFPVELKSAV
jgi:hypothetical protein